MSVRLVLPNRRHHITQKVKISGQRTLYLSVHDDPHPAEIFLRLKGSDCPSELIGLYDVIARLTSLALQHGVPLEKVGDLAQASNSRRAAQCPGMIASSSARVCRISLADTCWWSTAVITSWVMFMEQHRRRSHHDFEGRHPKITPRFRG